MHNAWVTVKFLAVKSCIIQESPAISGLSGCEYVYR